MSSPKTSLHMQWSRIANGLNMRQYEKTMGIMDYKAKAQAAMPTTRSKRLHALCLTLIANYDDLHSKPELTLFTSDVVISRRSRANLVLIAS